MPTLDIDKKKSYCDIVQGVLHNPDLSLSCPRVVISYGHIFLFLSKFTALDRNLAFLLTTLTDVMHSGPDSFCICIK